MDSMFPQHLALLCEKHIIMTMGVLVAANIC